MRLLVSVRDAAEAGAALAGGGDIIDAKEPSRGPLAPVSSPTLRAISASVPVTVPLSVALGDTGADSLVDLVASVAPMEHRRALFFKAAVLGGSADAAAPGIAAACRVIAARDDRPTLVIARYVDGPADAANLHEWLAAAAGAGARGLLLDTSRKDGPGLFASVTPHALAMLRREATRRHVWLAVAGGVTGASLAQLAIVRPDVVGVRGAVCDGDRTGKLSGDRVAALRLALAGLTPRRRLRALPA